MIAQAKEVNDGIGIDVAATLISKKELVANVMDAYNVIEIDNDYVENVIYYGKGAGRYVTASAVVSDIIKTTQAERWIMIMKTVLMSILLLNLNIIFEQTNH